MPKDVVDIDGTGILKLNPSKPLYASLRSVTEDLTMLNGMKFVPFFHSLSSKFLAPERPGSIST